MSDIGTGPTRPLRKHLQPRHAGPSAIGTVPGDDHSPTHRQGNGVRMHGIYFAVVSLVGLALVITFVALTSTMR